MLAVKGIETAEDLLYHLPFRYEDRQNPRSLDELTPGETTSVIAEVRGAALLRTRKAPLFELTLGQGRLALKCIWFHAPYLEGKFNAGQTVAVYGKVEPSRSTSNFKMIQPQFEVLPNATDDAVTQMLEVGRITPVYESLGGNKLTSRWQRKTIFNLLESMRGAVPECLPLAMLERLELPDRETALREAHFPPEGTSLAQLQAAATPAHRRLIFEELFFLELGLELKRRRMRKRPGIAFTTNAKVREAIREVLPFHPTTAQKRVLGEIVADMRTPSPMRRLLQGDVGSGKTIVALQAMLVAMENGYQAALMAPTEILATQHFLAMRKLLEKSSRKPRIVLLTGSLDEARKRHTRGLINRGEAQLVIGTHALIEEKVEFDRLGLVVVDEQHRFGVLQRFKLMKKPDQAGANQAEPDVLVMTATPIPRTLAMTMYGDLDVSVIDEMPPGRKPIVTKHSTSDRIEQVYSFVKAQIEEGRQAYVVYPVIEESETQAMKAAQKEYEHLSREVFPAIPVGLMHGRLGAGEKESVMQRFKDGQIKILVSTTVIEVGVDVPNASVMVVEQAERFGLAQLHQLRGRVGRGAAQSYCLLVTDKMNDTARERIRTLVESTDGFYISEMDLKLRGPGEFFGTKQSGLPSLRIANILRDAEILEVARRDAVDFIAHPPSEDHLRRAVAYIRDHWQRRYGLVTVG
jgi:ATP-dependent DNA helicase RecG